MKREKGTRRDEPRAKRLRTATKRERPQEEDENYIPELPEDVMRSILHAAMYSSSPPFMTYGTLCKLSESSAMMARLTAGKRGEMREELRQKVRACLFGGQGRGANTMMLGVRGGGFFFNPEAQ